MIFMISVAQTRYQPTYQAHGMAASQLLQDPALVAHQCRDRYVQHPCHLLVAHIVGLQAQHLALDRLNEE